MRHTRAQARALLHALTHIQQSRTVRTKLIKITNALNLPLDEQITSNQYRSNHRPATIAELKTLLDKWEQGDYDHTPPSAFVSRTR